MRRGRRIVAVVVAALTGLLGGAGTGFAMDRVSLRTEVFLTGEHASFFLGIDKGFYRDESIELTVNAGTGSGTTIKLVGNGNDTFGLTDTFTMIKAAATGVPVKVMMGLVQKTPLVIVALPDSGITGPRDLVGKRMAGTPGSANEQLFPAFCETTKIDCSTITMIQTDVPTKSTALMARRVDATFVSLLGSVQILEDSLGRPLSILRYADHLSILGNNVIAHRDLLKRNPDLVQRFVRASTRSWKYAADHPEEAVAAFVRRSERAKAKVVSAQFRATLGLLETARTHGRPFGWMSTEDWTDTIRLAERYVDVARGSVRPEDLFTNEFVGKD